MKLTKLFKNIHKNNCFKICATHLKFIIIIYMPPIDKRNILDEEPFEYRELKDNKVQIYWNNKPVMLIKGADAVKLLNKLKNSEGKQQQLILAKVTGNFKRGNEKSRRNKL